MNNKTLAWVLVALVVIVGVWYWFASAQPGNDNMVGEPSPQPNPPAATPPAAGTPPGPATSGTQPTNINPDHVIKFGANGYEPATLTVKKGTQVYFQNESQADMWPASARHPTHSVYPTSGGCIGSTFDACQGVKPGGGFSFTFDEVGTWLYHDHLNSQLTGRVVVE